MEQKDILKSGLQILKNGLDEEKGNTITTKFNNISGKTGKYFVPETLFQKRTFRNNRALIPFKHVVEGKISYEQLEKTFEGGVVVEFVNNDFFDQLELPEQEQNEVFSKLKDKLGSDEKVSAIIDIRGTGSSSSKEQRDAYKKLEKWLAKKGYKEPDVLLRRKNIKYPKNTSGKGNEKWEGFVYYSIKGGQQDVADSHVKYKIDPKKVHLFNPSVEYAGAEVSNDITLVLIYFAFYSIPKTNRDADWIKVRDEFREYFKKRVYTGESLYDYVDNHISLNLQKGILMDPIQVEPIEIDDFTRKERDDEDAVDITHQISVKRHSYVWDENLNVLLTPARPTNLFWSKHSSNMMQQDYSLKDYILNQEKIMKKWEEFGLENIE
ncbi:hypothetical protein [Lactobacillus apis]|uniref:Uncharacterized protein n=1 Tax=Lactobacillus apis TaxID=303541 RepID=A0A0F4LQM2_9LACO|nr:hypothetical protein [Lactobacillus apis]KJY61107.1 uncharacterized protein JF72_03830 [Lactobacillus apis]